MTSGRNCLSKTQKALFRSENTSKFQYMKIKKVCSSTDTTVTMYWEKTEYSTKSDTQSGKHAARHCPKEDIYWSTDLERAAEGREVTRLQGRHHCWGLRGSSTMCATHSPHALPGSHAAFTQCQLPKQETTADSWRSLPHIKDATAALPEHAQAALLDPMDGQPREDIRGPAASEEE